MYGTPLLPINAPIVVRQLCPRENQTSPDKDVPQVHLTQPHKAVMASADIPTRPSSEVDDDLEEVLMKRYIRRESCSTSGALLPAAFRLVANLLC